MLLNNERVPEMDQNVTDLAEKLLQSGYDDLPDREQRVLRRIARRAAISENVNARFHDKLTFGQRVADRVAAFGGSWSFIIIFFVILIAWVLLNTVTLPGRDIVDPYPFVFLNLILSMIAAFQAPVIMMSQNRQGIKDRLAANHDYEVNLKAELEIMQLHEKLDDVRTRQLETILKQQNDQMSHLVTLIEKKGAGK